VIKSDDALAFEITLSGQLCSAIGRVLRSDSDLEFSVALHEGAGLEEVHGVVSHGVLCSIVCVHRGATRQVGVIRGGELGWSFPESVWGFDDVEDPRSLIPLWQALLDAVINGKLVTPELDNAFPGAFLVGTQTVLSSEGARDLVFSIGGDPDNFDPECRYEAHVDLADHHMRWSVVHQCGSPMEAMPNVDGWAVFDGRVALTSWSGADITSPAWLCLGTEGPLSLNDEAARLQWIAAWGHAMFIAGGLDSEAQMDRTGA
jgi:hypothetical protein